MKPFSQACENNQEPICKVLSRVFAHSSAVLEIGSGTGQHAVYLSPRLPHVQWHTSDREENLPGINAWIDEYPASNLHRPVILDVTQAQWPTGRFDAVFTANTCHIMPWPAVGSMLRQLGRMLEPHSTIAIYGPFKYGGKFTTPSNAGFDQWLKSRDPGQGIRNIEDITALAIEAGFELVEDNPMPANNQLLVFTR